ncbi:hypothetical protein RhiirA4_454189 [Rhizophagus irregularis]|uniref:Uncharacterized protein n=1 Tax=Rhizophagus irregularis TaxID=588596 RepID=A0A2I1G295_9GLOM|nr:hypothetical protein RhiirA4_454189 [Rhizophagus irregularis]
MKSIRDTEDYSLIEDYEDILGRYNSQCLFNTWYKTRIFSSFYLNINRIVEHVLKWGLAQNPTLIPDPKTWSDDDFKTMKIILQNCRFFSLSSKEFSQKVRPYQKLRDQQLYEELLNSYLEPGGVSKYNDLRPRKMKINDSQIIDSKIVDSNIISTVSNWV